MKTLYLDLDDTYLDTDVYIRKVLKENGVSKELWGIQDDIYVLLNNPKCKDIIQSCMSNYSVIPTKIGAKESLQVLKTEYKVIFVTSVFSGYEFEAKKKFFKNICVPYIIVGSNKSCVNMKDATFIDDHLIHLNQSNASTKVFFFNQFEMNPQISTGILRKEYKVVKDWFELTDFLMSGGEDFELRKYIHQRVQECCHTSWV